MAALIYSAITSLDGFIEDERGSFDWAAPDEQVHAFLNDVERPIGTHLYGRRMYQTMVYWETEGSADDDSAASRDFAGIWRNADKIVYSRTLETATSGRTRIEPDFDPAAIAALKQTSPHDLSIGGPALAAEAFAAGLVDECHLFLHPVIVGRGRRALPEDDRIHLELLDDHRFDSGVVHLHYAVRS